LKLSCIIGAIAYCTANIVIAGPLHMAQGGNPNYVTYYGPPVISGYAVSLPAYANPQPGVIPTTAAVPYTAPRGAYRRT
jgi:hypothetical protein